MLLLPYGAGGRSSDSDECDIQPPELDDPSSSDSGYSDEMPELECGTDDGDESSDEDPPDLDSPDDDSSSISSDKAPPLEAVDDDEESGDEPPGLMDADSATDSGSMPGEDLRTSYAVWKGLKGRWGCEGRELVCSCKVLATATL
jgi:hypothetical protein